MSTTATSQADQADDDEPCVWCYGTGGVYVHAPSCASDFCVGNGDEWSCLGEWVPCPRCEYDDQRPSQQQQQGPGAGRGE